MHISNKESHAAYIFYTIKQIHAIIYCIADIIDEAFILTNWQSLDD